MNTLNPTRKPVDIATLQSPAVSFALPDAASAGEDALEKALVFATAKLSLPSTQSVVDRLRLGDSIAVQYVSYGLAIQIGQTLGTLDETVQTVYLFEDFATPEDLAFAQPTRLTVNLIAHVERKTKAFESLAQALARSLAVRYGELIASDNPIHLLSIHAVDSVEIGKRSGYGALVTSLHHQPMKVWQRQPLSA